MLTQILDAWNDPSMRHAMVIHFPVVLSLIGVPFAVAAALVKPKSKALRWAVLALYLVFAATAWVARNSGHDAEEVVEGSLDDEGHEELEEHEHHGHNLWMWPAGISILIGVSFVSHRWVRLPSAWLAVGVGLIAAERVAHTADHGGRLVYEHGAGAPDRLAEWFATADGSAEPSGDPRLDFFRSEVRPVLAGECWRCHNPKRKRRSGGLDQTTMAGLLAGGYSGPAVVPGKPDESWLIKAVRWEVEDLQMPAGEDQLPPETIAKLEQWIRDGAVWEAIELPPSQEQE